jgi:hypothetical protein
VDAPNPRMQEDISFTNKTELESTLVKMALFIHIHFGLHKNGSVFNCTSHKTDVVIAATKKQMLVLSPLHPH